MTDAEKSRRGSLKQRKEKTGDKGRQMKNEGETERDGYGIKNGGGQGISNEAEEAEGEQLQTRKETGTENRQRQRKNCKTTATYLLLSNTLIPDAPNSLTREHLINLIKIDIPNPAASKRWGWNIGLAPNILGGTPITGRRQTWRG